MESRDIWEKQKHEATHKIEAEALPGVVGALFTVHGAVLRVLEEVQTLSEREAHRNTYDTPRIAQAILVAMEAGLAAARDLERLARERKEATEAVWQRGAPGEG